MFTFEHVSLTHKIMLSLLGATSSLQFSLPRLWHNVYHQRYTSDEEVKTAVMKWLKEMSTQFYDTPVLADQQRLTFISSVGTFTSHLTNHPSETSKTRWALLEEQLTTNKRHFSMVSYSRTYQIWLTSKNLHSSANPGCHLEDLSKG